MKDCNFVNHGVPQTLITYHLLGMEIELRCKVNCIATENWYAIYFPHELLRGHIIFVTQCFQFVQLLSHNFKRS